MKKLLLLLSVLLAGVSGAWAETSTWESKEGWVQSSGGMGSYTWFGVHTPGDASTKYSLTAIQLMQQTGSGDNDNYLAIARVSATSTLNAGHVVAISDNHLAASQSTGSLETYNFSAGVELLGGTTYYLVFLSSNTPTDGAYPVRAGRLSLNHTDYGTYPYGNSYSLSSSHWLYYKATVESSPATGFCTGDILGVSMESGNWKSLWTSGTTPSFTITSNANNINNSAAKPAGGLDIRSGSAEIATYTITAPTGYIVTGYKIAGYALNGAQTVTPSKGGVATEFTGIGNSISVSGLRQKKASFTLSGANNGLFIRAMQVSLASVPSITSLPTTNNKAYVIYNERAAWNFVNNATSMNADNMDLDNEQQRIALIYHNENYYLYSINAGKYLTANNTLTSVVTDNEQISITATGNATYPWFFSFKNVANKNINIDGNPAVRINEYSTLDDGNRNAIIEADDFDATEALEMFDNRYVTYNLNYGGNSTFRTVNNVVVAIGGDPADYVPEAWKAAYCTLTYDVETIEESTATINVTSTWNGLFDFSTDFASAVWYCMQINRNKWLSAGSTSEDVTSVVAGADISTSDVALWAFIGNPYDGVKIINKSIGEGYYGQAGYPFNISSADENTLLTIVKDEEKGLMFKNSAGKYMELLNDGVAFYYDTPYSNANIITLRSYYCQKFIDDVYAWADANHRDEYFGPSEASLTALQNVIISMYPKMTNLEYSGFSIPNDILSNIVMKYPSTGYYRIKNNGTGDYLAYGQPAAPYVEKTPGLIAISSANAATDFSSIIKLTGSSGTYKLSTEGLNVQSQTTSNQAFPATSSEGANFGFTSANKNGIVSITNADSRVDDNNDGSLHNATGWTVNGVVNWSASASNSKWLIEDATTVTVPLTYISDNNASYSTLYLPFGATITGAKAYILTVSGEWAIPSEITEIPANTGVLLRADGEVASATVTINDEASAETTGNMLVGTNVDITADRTTGEYIIGNDATDGLGFYQRKSGRKIGANKAYLQLDADLAAGVKGLLLNFDIATGIDGLTPDPSLSKKGEEIFNLAGQRMSRVQKGVNIVNGKKVLVK